MKKRIPDFTIEILAFIAAALCMVLLVGSFVESIDKQARIDEREKFDKAYRLEVVKQWTDGAQENMRKEMERVKQGKD